MPTYLVGPARTYTTIQGAIDAIPSSLTGTGIHEVIIDEGIYDESVNISNSNGSASNYIIIRSATGDEHLFDFNSGVRVDWAAPSASGTPTFAVQTNYTRVQNIICKRNTGVNSGNTFRVTSANGIFENVIGVHKGGGAGGFGLANGASQNKFYKCFSIALVGSIFSGFAGSNSVVDTNYFYNCGTRGFSSGYLKLAGEMIVRNSWASATTCFNGLFTTALCSNNASTDSTAPGSNFVRSVTLGQMAFVNSGAHNYHIFQTSVLFNAGTDLSVEFTTDIDLQTIQNWCIGPEAPFLPVANFSGTPLTGVVPLEVTFTDLSTNAPSSWSWSFGDGGTSTSQNPTHTYTTPGAFTVSLTATNVDGNDTETKIAYIALAQSSLSIGGVGFVVLQWPKPKITPSILWTQNAANYWSGSDRGFAQDVYEADVTFLDRSTAIDELAEALEDNREGISLSGFVAPIFSPNVDHTGTINATITSLKRRQLKYGVPSQVYALDVTFRAISPSVLGTTPSLSTLKLQEGFEASQSYEIGKAFAYNQTAFYGDHASDVGTFIGRFRQTTPQIQAILAYLLTTARASTVAFPSIGVTYPFGVPRGGLPKNCKIKSFSLSRVNFVFWDIEIEFVEAP